jgi:hypothetical protein
MIFQDFGYVALTCCAVAAAYGWSPDLTDDEILAALGALHQAPARGSHGTDDTGTAEEQQHC